MEIKSDTFILTDAQFKIYCDDFLEYAVKKSLGVHELTIVMDLFVTLMKKEIGLQVEEVNKLKMPVGEN